MCSKFTLISEYKVSTKAISFSEFFSFYNITTIVIHVYVYLKQFLNLNEKCELNAKRNLHLAQISPLIIFLHAHSHVYYICTTV